jgi:hypothetical protein
MLVDIINERWGWNGAAPVEIIEINKFGNIIFTDDDGMYWRLCPEEVDMELIAENKEEYDELLEDDEFLMDWEMKALVDISEARYGKQPQGLCFCLCVPGVLDGEYDISNIDVIAIEELVSLSGDVAQQLESLPEDAEIDFSYVDQA